jgi:hypothetical protein
MTEPIDYDVTVCDLCLTASCWHGEVMCQYSAFARTTTRKASELRKLNFEHADNYSPKKLREVTGVDPTDG